MPPTRGATAAEATSASIGGEADGGCDGGGGNGGGLGAGGDGDGLEGSRGVRGKDEGGGRMNAVPCWQRGVVAIGVRKATGAAALMGTGWIIDLTAGLVCTCAHVVIDCHRSGLDPLEHGMAIGIGMGTEVRWVLGANIKLISGPPSQYFVPQPWIDSTHVITPGPVPMLNPGLDLAVLQLCEWNGAPLAQPVSTIQWHREGQPAGALPLGRTTPEPHLVDGDELILLGYGQGRGMGRGHGQETSTTCCGHYAGRFSTGAGEWLKIGVTVYSGHSGGPVISASRGHVVGWAVSSFAGDPGPNGQARPIEALEGAMGVVLDRLGRPAADELRDRLEGQLECVPMGTSELQQVWAACDEAKDAAMAHAQVASDAASSAASHAQVASDAASSAAFSLQATDSMAQHMYMARMEALKYEHQLLKKGPSSTPQLLSSLLSSPVTNSLLHTESSVVIDTVQGSSQGSSSTALALTRSPSSPREVFTICLEGDVDSFDAKREDRLKHVFAGLVGTEICSGPCRIRIEKPRLASKMKARIGTKRCCIRVEVDESQLPQHSTASYSSGAAELSDSQSDTSVEDDIEQSTLEMTKSRAWPSHISVGDINVVFKFFSSVLLVLLVHPVAAHVLFQLAKQRDQTLLLEGVRSCKLGDCVARLDDRADIEDCVRKTCDAEKEAISKMPDYQAEKQLITAATRDDGKTEAPKRVHLLSGSLANQEPKLARKPGTQARLQPAPAPEATTMATPMVQTSSLTLVVVVENGELAPDVVAQIVDDEEDIALTPTGRDADGLMLFLAPDAGKALQLVRRYSFEAGGGASFKFTLAVRISHSAQALLFASGTPAACDAPSSLSTMPRPPSSSPATSRAPRGHLLLLAVPSSCSSMPSAVPGFPWTVLTTPRPSPTRSPPQAIDQASG